MCPNVIILNKCTTLFVPGPIAQKAQAEQGVNNDPVESQLQGKRLRWLGHVFSMLSGRLPKKLLFGDSLRKLRGFAYLAALSLGPMMLRYIISRLPKTGCSGGTRLVLHLPSSS
ncbi:TPA: hypothetical protein ACH3X2_010577 [Trebouxia sp. C0005]